MTNTENSISLLVDLIDTGDLGDWLYRGDGSASVSSPW